MNEDTRTLAEVCRDNNIPFAHDWATERFVAALAAAGVPGYGMGVVTGGVLGAGGGLDPSGQPYPMYVTAIVQSRPEEVVGFYPNPNRAGVTIYNDAPRVLIVALGEYVDKSTYSKKLLPAECWELPFGYNGAFRFLWYGEDVADGDFRNFVMVTEVMKAGPVP